MVLMVESFTDRVDTLSHTMARVVGYLFPYLERFDKGDGVK
jgi:hypothetical protein